MLKAYHYRIYPTKGQISILNKTLEICRKIFNDTLALQKDLYESNQKTMSFFDTTKILTSWKEKDPNLYGVYSLTLQDAQLRVDLAFKSFYRKYKKTGKTGFPRFKGEERYKSITYIQRGFKIKPNVLYLSKIGDIRIKMHREPKGEIKSVIVKRSPRGKWYASIVCEFEPIPNFNPPQECVGIDLGIKSFATLSNGENIKNPLFYKKDKKELSKYKNRLYLSQPNSSQRKKYSRVYARIHERISNRRDNFIHQESRKLVNHYGTIVFEKLNINGLMEDASFLNENIIDSSWNRFVNITNYKAEEAGNRVIFVNPENTSVICSKCGATVPKTLRERSHRCPTCGLSIDRDLNASINILRLGLQSLRSNR